MTDCPEPAEQKLACMRLLGELKQGQSDLRAWMAGIGESQKELVQDVAYMRGKLDAQETTETRAEKREGRRWGRMTAAITAVLTAVAGAIAAAWKLNE